MINVLLKVDYKTLKILKLLIGKQLQSELQSESHLENGLVDIYNNLSQALTSLEEELNEIRYIQQQRGDSANPDDSE